MCMYPIANSSLQTLSCNTSRVQPSRERLILYHYIYTFFLTSEHGVTQVTALEEQLREMARTQKQNVNDEHDDADNADVAKRQEEVGRLEKEVHILQAAVRKHSA